MQNQVQTKTRFVQWGNWGIDLREREGDAWANPGRRVSYVAFGVGSCGPVDGTYGSPTRERYLKICRDFVATGAMPEGATP